MPAGAGRSWTLLGTLASPAKAAVDDRGLVVVARAGWCLDWWIGGDDRWHIPSREAGTRQRLLDLTPVTETLMRVPGGDAVHRAYAVRQTSEPEDLLVVEVHNGSPVPFAVALVLRPLDPTRVPAGALTLDDRTVAVGGRPAVYLPGRPGRSLGAASADDLAAMIASAAGRGWPEGGAESPPVGREPTRAGQAAFVYPLAHSATIRLALPLGAAPVRNSPVRRGRTATRNPPPPASLPPASRAVRSWEAQTRRGLRAELPAGRLADAAQANRRFLLLFASSAVASSDCPLAEGARLAVALDRWGFHNEAAELVGALLAQRRDRRSDEPGAIGALLWAMGQHSRLTGDARWARSVVQPVATAAERIERARRRPASSPADAWWRLAVLRESVALLRAADEEEAAQTAAAWAGAASEDAGAVPAVDVDTLHTLDMLEALQALGRWPAADGSTRRALEAVRHASNDPTPAELLRLAALELLAGDRAALDGLARAVDAASGTFTWSTSPAGGHDAGTAAAFCRLVRDLLAHETADGLALCAMLPAPWFGEGIEVHGAPTSAGPLSFAVRWHGERAALLWELDRRGTAPVCLRAPGLDGRWSSCEPRGEALLGPVPGVEHHRPG